MPLFPSYVFVCGSDQDRQVAMMTNRICRMIEVPDQPTLIAELSAVAQAMAGKAELDPYPFAAVGQVCRITEGAFQGLEGVVVRRSKSTRLVLQISLLGQGASMEIHPDLLEPVR